MVGTSVVFSMVLGVPSNLCVARSIGSKMMLKKWGIFVLAVLISWLQKMFKKGLLEIFWLKISYYDLMSAFS